MNFLKSFISNSLTICLICSFNFVPKSSSLNITILHNNDFHTHFEPINVWSNECKPQNNETCFGGIARTVTKVNQILSEVSEDKVLFLNAGDHFQGTIWYSFEKWRVVSEFVKFMRHDAMALGNHEFDDGVEGLLPFVKNMTQNNEKNLPILCSNIETSGELQQLIKPSIIVSKANTSIAIIGYITPDTSFLARPGNTVKFNDEIESIKKEMTNIKQTFGNSINIFIAVGHSGFEKDKEIAAKIPELDIVVGGHTNTFLYTGEPPSIEPVEGPYPLVFDHGDQGKTLVVQAFAFGKYLGKLDVVFDENGIITSYGGNPILLDETVEEDPEVALRVKEKSLEIDKYYNENIGSSKVLLDSLKCREQECNTGNMFADAFVSYFVDQPINRKEGWISVAASIVNGGAVRSGMSIGNITTKDIVSVSPFGNLIGILNVNGSNLWQILEHSASQYKMGGFLQVSGIRYQFDSNQTIGKRLKSVRIRCADCLTPAYEDLDNDKIYSIVITEYLVRGGDNYTMIKESDFTAFEIIDYQVLSDYVGKYSPVIAGIEDRIINSKAIEGNECPNEDPINGNSGHSSYGINFYNNIIILFICFIQLMFV